MPSGFTVSRCGPRGRPFTVESVHMGVCMHEGIEIGDIFFKDGDIEVHTYTVKQVTELLRTATYARQAAFSFLTPAAYSFFRRSAPSGTQVPQALASPVQQPLSPSTTSTSSFNDERSPAQGPPYVVRTVEQRSTNQAGEPLHIIPSYLDAC
jgi:hypothetical protein